MIDDVAHRDWPHPIRQPRCCMIDIINYRRWLSYQAMSYQAREQARERYLFWRANILDTLGASEAQVEGVPDEVLEAFANFLRERTFTTLAPTKNPLDDLAKK